MWPWNTNFFIFNKNISNLSRPQHFASYVAPFFLNIHISKALCISPSMYFSFLLQFLSKCTCSYVHSCMWVKGFWKYATCKQKVHVLSPQKMQWQTDKQIKTETGGGRRCGKAGSTCFPIKTPVINTGVPVQTSVTSLNFSPVVWCILSAVWKSGFYLGISVSSIHSLVYESKFIKVNFITSKLPLHFLPLLQWFIEVN